MAHDVFISYAKEDKLTADALCARLEQHGIRCWIAPRDILPGRDWRVSIVEAIGSARALVLMLSANANLSSEIPKEILQATQKSLPIITFRIEDVTPAGPLSYELNSIHWLDAVTRPLERHMDSLAATLQRLLNVEAPTPPFSAVPAQKASSMPAVVGAVLATVIVCAGLAFWLLGQRDPSSSVQQQATQEGGPAGSVVSPPPNPEPVSMSPSAAPPATPPRTDGPKPVGPASGSLPGPAAKSVSVRSQATPSDLPGNEMSNVPPSQKTPEANVVGCWRLAGQPGIIQVRPNGTFVSGGVVNGTWTAANSSDQSYVFQFPEDTTWGEISQDGTRLGDPAVPSSLLTRVSGDSGIVGVWRGLNGLPFTVEADGTFKVASFGGKWKLVDQGRRIYTFVWPGARPTVTVSPDHNSIRYVDTLRGIVQELQRLPC